MTERHKKVAFYGVPNSTDYGYSLTRMKFFTSLGISKNPIERNVKYVDEATQRNAVVGYDPAIDYAFDDTAGDPVLNDIKKITTEERTGDAAKRWICIVDLTDNDKAVLREYTVMPGTEGDDANFYGYAGTFKANGEPTIGTATISANGQSCTFTPPDTN